MDIFSHALWANLIFPGNFPAVTLGSVIPDLPNGPNWLYRFITGKGSFWKTKKDLIGLTLGTDKYADGYKYVNRGPLYQCTLILNSVFALLLVWILALTIDSKILNKYFASAYTFHLILDLFTHKGTECVMRPFYPFSDLGLDFGIVRWGLQPKWYVILNFIILAILYSLNKVVTPGVSLH